MILPSVFANRNLQKGKFSIPIGMAYTSSRRGVTARMKIQRVPYLPRRPRTTSSLLRVSVFESP